MKALLALLSLVGLFAVALLPSTVGAQAQESARVDAKQLKTLITGLGYTVKDLNTEVGKEKYEFTITRDDLDIPIAAEISGSKNYVWLTVYLGDQPKDAAFTAKALPILKQNFKIQPCQFYVTAKDALMVAIAIDNRNVDAAVLRRNIDKLGADVAGSKDLWL
ncbi:MAG: hypothetical protein KF784_06775 [Fimbriimonadaceae bacterium]|nr:hypothetical protein [Fimbriimonadaceae bacterium]